MIKNVAALTASLGLAVATLVGCGGSNEAAAPSPSPSPTPTAAPADDKYACTLVRMAFNSTTLSASDLHH